MENTLKKINLNYFVVYLNLTQHCKSTILQFNKKLPFKTSKAEESLKVKQNKTKQTHHKCANVGFSLSLMTFKTVTYLCIPNMD